MKKTIVALAVAAFAATAANATTVFEKDNTKVDVSGKVKVYLEKAKDKRSDLVNDGSELTVSASHKLSEGLTALGAAKIKVDNEKFGDDVKLNQLYAGFEFDGVGTLTFGRQNTIADGLDVSDYTYTLSGINQVVTKGQKVVSFKSADFNGFTAGVSYVFDNSPSKQDELGENDPNERTYVLGAAYEGKFAENGGYKFGLAHSHAKKSVDNSEKAFLVGGEVSYAGFSFGVDFSQLKATNGAVYEENYVGKANVVDNPKLKVVTLAHIAALGLPAKAGNKTAGFVTDTDVVALKESTEVDYKVQRLNKVELGLKYQVTDKSSVYGVYNWAKGKATLAITAPADHGALKTILEDGVNGGQGAASKYANVVTALEAAGNTYAKSVTHKETGFALGADYQFNNNVVTFIEGGKTKVKTPFETTTDHTVRVGLRVMF